MSQERMSETKAWWVVSLLGVMYVLSFVDRSILALLVAPLKADLKVSDVEIGFLIGPAFGVFYAVLGLPIGRLADHSNRAFLVVCGVLIWGAATIGSAFAIWFWILVLLRIGLAVGEAVLTPAAYSMIGDMFQPNRRAFASSVYSAMGMAGASASYIFGAALIGYVSSLNASGLKLPLAIWQIVMIAVGVPSVLSGLLFAVTVKEPRRESAGMQTPSIGEVAKYLWQHVRMFGFMFLGAGLMQAIIYGNQAWAAEYLRRTFSLPPQQAGMMLGCAGLIGSFGGTIGVPACARVLGRRGRQDAVILTTMGGLLIGSILAFLAPLQSNAWGFVVLFAGALFFMVGGTNNVLISLQHLTPDRMRATIVGLLLMSISLLGLGIGPVLVALISSALDASGMALGEALSALAPIIALPALVLLGISRGGIPPVLAVSADYRTGGQT
jgi:MFS family permease